MTVTAPHLVFTTVLFAAALVAWILDLDRHDTPLVIGGTVIAGLGTGLFMGAWL